MYAHIRISLKNMIKFVIFDFDGVFTTGNIIFDDFLYSGFHCVHPNYILKFRENKISLQHVILLIHIVIEHDKQN